MHPPAHPTVDDVQQSFARTHTSAGPFGLIRVDSIRYRHTMKQLAVVHGKLIISQLLIHTVCSELIYHTVDFDYRLTELNPERSWRSRDFLWGCTFFLKKLITFFSRRPQCTS